VIGYTAEGF